MLNQRAIVSWQHGAQFSQQGSSQNIWNEQIIQVDPPFNTSYCAEKWDMEWAEHVILIYARLRNKLYNLPICCRRKWRLSLFLHEAASEQGLAKRMVCHHERNPNSWQQPFNLLAIE
jgi:hypothetical protein